MNFTYINNELLTRWHDFLSRENEINKRPGKQFYVRPMAPYKQNSMGGDI